MFPVNFADDVVTRYTAVGDAVLDPFAGRCTAVFSAASRGRSGLGVEINPVGWIYGKTKLGAAAESDVNDRLMQIGRHAGMYDSEARHLPLFFRHCFSASVRRFLVAARRELRWRRCAVDRTAMAFILIYLHGKRDYSLSNQMRQTKAMAPAYAVRWWSRAELKPPKVDPVEFLVKRVKWRYAKGRPNLAPSNVYLGDATKLLSRRPLDVRGSELLPARLLLTSPPYYKITNYHYDQWLRLWLLGGRPDAARSGEVNRGKFENLRSYRALLERVLSASARLLTDDAVVYVRTDRRPETLSATREVLKEVFPQKSYSERARPFKAPTQTRLFGDATSKVGEVDVVLLPR